MKKALTLIAVLSGVAAAIAYRMKKEEEKKITELEKELLEEENNDCDGECDCEADSCECEEESCCCSHDETTCAEEKTEVELETNKEEAPMSEYPYLNTETKKQIDAMNEETISALSSDGDVHSNERPIQHNVEFKNEEDLEAYKLTVINKGFVVTKGEGLYEISVLHIAPIDRFKLLENIYYLANQAMEHHGVYKGWKSRVSY